MSLFYLGDFINLTYEDLERFSVRRFAIQSVAEDVEYEDVSESECEMIETSNNEQK